MSRFILPSTKKIFQNTCKKNFLTFELEYNIIFFMATYNFTFTMTAHQTGTAGHYPIKAGNTTFSTTTTLFAKAGDTVNYIISEGDGSTVHYLDNTNPDPTASGTGTYPVMASGATWSHTLASNFTAVEWYYFGGTTQGSGRKYSNRVVTRRVAGAFTNSNGASVVQGGSITFTVSGTASLPGVSGSSNYLYIGIRKGGTMVHTNHTPAGMYWDSGNNQLGKVHTGDLSTVMTVGSNMTPGTDYSAHLYHYSPVTSAAFYDPLNELDSVTFTITAPDTTPNSFSLGADHTNVGVNTTVTTSSATITGIDAPASISVSGDGSPEYQIGNGGFTSSNGTISSGQSVTMRFTASSSAGTAHTATLTVGGVSDSVTATTASASDSTPDAFAFSPDTYSNYALSTYQTTEPVTITGIDTTASVSISSTGNSPDAKWAKGESPSDSDYTASSGTVVNNDKVRMKFRSSSVNSQTNTATLNVGGVSDTVSITTTSSTSGSGSGAATGGVTYGLMIRNASGNVIFGPNSRAGHLVKSGNVSIPQNGTPVDVTSEGIVAGNEINILIDIGGISVAVGTSIPQITRVNASGGNPGYFRITWTLGYSTGSQLTKYWIIRY